MAVEYVQLNTSAEVLKLTPLSPGRRHLFPDQRNQHSLDAKLARGNQIRVKRVLRLQVRAAMLRDVTLQGRFAVDQGRDDIAVLHIFSIFQDRDIALQN